MSNSGLVNYTKMSPNYSNRGTSIKKITIHHMAGNLSVEVCGNVFANPAAQASATYGVGTDGRVGQYVDEKYRPWTSSNADNDNQAVTIEVANDVIGGNWHVSDAALQKTILLCADICKRNGISRLNFTGNASGNLTMHKYFAATTCPGPYLESKFSYIAAEVNKLLSGNASQPSQPPATSGTYQVKIVNNAIYVLDGPSPNNNIVQTIYKNEVYTIVETRNGYGKLKSGAGWINLSYTTVVAGTQNDGTYKVRIVNNAIYVLNGPSPNYDIVQTIYKNEVYTIVETRNGYGKLKSGAGWINLSYTAKL